MSENKEPSSTPAPGHRMAPRAPLWEDMGSPATHQMRVVGRRRSEAEAKLEQHLHRTPEAQALPGEHGQGPEGGL
ncbi:hypothetical protein [Arthrobacter sp. MA-N2]|uniref:hypothetical protein n=1 Tax=Arthrobacter sp. MA-N2 TaxID=1101188 RepID=UPI0004B4A695|nr:hypothetical protein [Arthrobacter sp. MA-N2]